MMELRDTIATVMEELGLLFTTVDDAIVAGFYGHVGRYVLCVREIERPAMLSLHYALDVFVDEDDDTALTFCLAVNDTWWLLKVGRQPVTGEMVADIEIPLRGAKLTADEARHYVTIGGGLVEEFLERLAMVRWGGMSVADALEAEMPRGPSQRPKWRCARSAAEQEAESIIRELMEGEDAGGSA